MKRLGLDLTEQKHTILKTCAAQNQTKMNLIIEEATAEHLWKRYGILWPGYVPTECHYCERPMSAHVFIPATATEPGGYECPGDDEVEF